MRCSSCKPLLDRYLDGTLSTPQLLAVSAHLEDCHACTALLEEVKVVDGLLATVRTPEPPPNFRFAVMAEVRSMPAPVAPRTPIAALAGLYTVIAWAIIAGWLRLSGVTAHAALSSLAGAGANVFGTIHAVAGSVMDSFGHGAPFVTTFVIVVLALDLTVAAGIAFVYLFVRPRLAAQLAPVREAR